MNPRIDSLLGEHFAKTGLSPAPRCDDLAFLRRITLDLAGRVPSLEEIRSFEDSPGREAKIDELLAAESFPRHWANIWTAMLNGYSNAFRSDREALRIWLEEQFSLNRPYDELVTELVTATGSTVLNGAVNFVARYPEDVTVRVSRLFLGVRLDCARCHDHPSDRWKKADFAQMARFFDSIDRTQAGNRNAVIENRIAAPDAPAPVFLTGAKPSTALWRDELALFITNTNAFAKNYANQIWYQLMGRGIVDPPDDFNAENAPVAPALLDALARFGEESKWDIREMIRAVCRSEAYRRSSATGPATPAEVTTNFAARTVKPFTPEQWFDSVTEISGGYPMRREEFLRRTIGAGIDEDFSETWRYRETSQHVMQNLAIDLEVPAETLDDLFLRVLARRPSEVDRETCGAHTLHDIAFALINSSEFCFNH